MLELNPYRKNKINLADYDYERDINNRLMLAQFTQDDIEILEEILYAPPKLPLEQLYDSLDLESKKIDKTLKNLVQSQLISVEEQSIFVNKEMRKYFEAQLDKFEEDFIPGMEFLQTLLKKVPIHVLPNWYPIPRSSDNIFDAIVEKYLETPQTYQRYLNELGFGDEIIGRIIEDLFMADGWTLEADQVMEKHGLTPIEFEELMLLLEFNFVCCISYREKNGKRQQIITPFHEWKEYLSHVHTHIPEMVEGEVVRYRPRDFAFVDDLTALLEIAESAPLAVRLNDNEQWTIDNAEMPRIFDAIDDLEKDGKKEKFYLADLIAKLLFFKLATIEDNALRPTEEAADWLNMPIERRGMALYRHSTNHINPDLFPDVLTTERNLKEIEKSLEGVTHHGWVCFDDFLSSLTVSLSDQSRVALQKVGRHWRYTIPTYSDTERELIEQTIMGWFFEAGVTAVGFCGEKKCFMVTGLGRKLFSQDL